MRIEMPANASRILILVTLDTDRDGMPDWWEDKHFGGPTNADATADSDGDGFNDGDEWTANTVPTNDASYFQWLDIQRDSVPSNGHVVRWNAATGRVYSIYWTPSLTNGVQALETNIHYPRNSYTDSVHDAESSGFYRVGVGLE